MSRLWTARVRLLSSRAYISYVPLDGMAEQDFCAAGGISVQNAERVLRGAQATTFSWPQC